MKPIKINGKEFDRLASSSSVEKCLQYAKEYLYMDKNPYVDDTGWVHKADGRRVKLYIHEWRGRIYLLMPLFNIEETKSSKNDTDMKRTTKKSACSTKGTRKSGTMSMAAKILHAQKEDYKKIFRTEVKKASDPKEGAKKAGRIYRERYGATAEARWKKALKRAK